MDRKGGSRSEFLVKAALPADNREKVSVPPPTPQCPLGAGLFLFREIKRDCGSSVTVVTTYGNTVSRHDSKDQRQQSELSPCRRDRRLCSAHAPCRSEGARLPRGDARQCRRAPRFPGRSKSSPPKDGNGGGGREPHTLLRSHYWKGFV